MVSDDGDRVLLLTGDVSAVRRRGIEINPERVKQKYLAGQVSVEGEPSKGQMFARESAIDLPDAAEGGSDDPESGISSEKVSSYSESGSESAEPTNQQTHEL